MLAERIHHDAAWAAVSLADCTTQAETDGHAYGVIVVVVVLKVHVSLPLITCLKYNSRTLSSMEGLLPMHAGCPDGCEKCVETKTSAAPSYKAECEKCKKGWTLQKSDEISGGICAGDIFCQVNDNDRPTIFDNVFWSCFSVGGKFRSSVAMIALTPKIVSIRPNNLVQCTNPFFKFSDRHITRQEAQLVVEREKARLTSLNPAEQMENEDDK